MADKEAQVSKANTQFAVDMYKALSKTPGNVFFSPLSAHAVLSMCYQGADGTTYDKFSSTLRMANKDLAAEGYQSIMQTLNGVPEIALHIANKVYLKVGCQLRKDFESVTVEKFKSAVELTNFAQSKAAASAINAWVREKTRDKIRKLFEDDAFDSDTCLVLINAIYFKGNWKKKFCQDVTTTEPFFVDERTTVDCRMMHNRADLRMEAVDDLQAKVVELPYTNTDVSMFVILPYERNGIAEVEVKLAEVDLEGVFKRIGESPQHAIRLALPKFKMEVFLDLKHTLTELGLGELFNPAQCNLSKMLDGSASLYVSEVIQKAFIEVNEEGAEAAAVTAVRVKTRCLVIKKATDFIVDHPFLFSIVTKIGDNSHVLFYGKVMQPQE